MSTSRVILIGLDAADPELILEAIAQGQLPAFARLQAAGAWGVIDPMPGFGSGAVWPSFFTGVSPARHGRYFYRQVWPGTYEAERFAPTDFKSPAIWDTASAAGRRVAIFDVPKASLSPDINGLHAVDWCVHGPVYKKLTTAPAELADELESRFGLDPLPQCDQPGGRTADEHRSLRDLMVDRVRTKTDAALHFLDQEPWDLFVTVYGEPHCIGHQSWHVRDGDHPLHDPAAKALTPDPLMDVYRAIDDGIARIVEAAGPETTVIVTSVTGMGPNYTGNYLLDDALRRMEGRRKTVAYDLLDRAKQVAKKLLPRETRRRYRRKSRDVEERVAHADRARRRTFVVPHNDIAGAIRVNLIGREPEGRVDPSEMNALHSELRKQLTELRNLETGGEVVSDVVRLADECAGEHIEDLPDFFVIWNREAPIERIGSKALGELEYRHRGNRTGDHHPESVFFAVGPGIAPAHIEDLSVMDFAPTLARLLDLDANDYDGRPIDALTGDSDRRR